MSQKINVWICGPFGKMGTELRSAINNEDDITITGVVSPDHVGSKCETDDGELEVYGSLEELSNVVDNPDVIVDFTQAKAAYKISIFSAKNSISFVI